MHQTGSFLCGPHTLLVLALASNRPVFSFLPIRSVAFAESSSGLTRMKPNWFR
jgi:hypothetical protein